MKKEHVRNTIKYNGESIVNYRSVNSKKLKYIVCTVDFDNDYIASKYRPAEQQDKILVFCWDSDSFKQLNVDLITSIEPINKFFKEPNE